MDINEYFLSKASKGNKLKKCDTMNEKTFSTLTKKTLIKMQTEFQQGNLMQFFCGTLSCSDANQQYIIHPAFVFRSRINSSLIFVFDVSIYGSKFDVSLGVSANDILRGKSIRKRIAYIPKGQEDRTHIYVSLPKEYQMKVVKEFIRQYIVSC